MEEVRIGDLIRVRSGQLVSIDDTIEDGIASLNEASMTGEAMREPTKWGIVAKGGNLKNVVESPSSPLQAMNKSRHLTYAR